MGKVVEKKKKKKGRPSLLDLQKRTIREQQEQQQQYNKKNLINNDNSAPKLTSNYKPATAKSIRRSTRRNPNPVVTDEEEDEEEDDDDEEELEGKKKKKLKLVVKLQKSSLNSNSNASDSDENGTVNNKKRKINAIGGGSGGGSGDYEKEEKSVSGTNPTNNSQGAQLESGPSTPLPDQKLLLFILDRVQKKDTYGVFSEPVDPEELPDYHEIIEHPMDFGTVRKKLNNGAYSTLEQFENDVLLISSNAMQYNAPDTVYFRQARAIHELAKKSFENLRHESDDNEPEPKVVRRGRPPTKNLKKPLGRPSLERARSEFSDATLATGTENINNHDRFGFADSSGRFYGSRNDGHSENKFDRIDEVSMSKGHSMKHGKKQFVPDETRRNTYKQFQLSAGGRESSVLATFNADRKQLMAVGLHSEHGYTRSLARFAANLGPVAWKIASNKVERCLPNGVKFGPGWVGENDIPPRPLLLSSPPQGQLSSSQAFAIPENLCSVATPSADESKEEKSTEKPEGENSSEKLLPSAHSTLDSHLIKPVPTSAINSPVNRPSVPHTEKGEKAEVVDGLDSHAGFNILNSSSVGAANKTRPPVQIHQNSTIHPGMNGLNGTYGFNLPAQMGKLLGAARSAGFDFPSSQALDSVSRTNTNFVHPVPTNNLNSEEDPKLAAEDNVNTIKPSKPLPTSEQEASAGSIPEHPQQTWQGMSPQQKPESVPPDLNVRFQSPGSPSSSSRVDMTQPDLALQL